MPQIWLTYDELADQFDCPPLTARTIAMERAFVRKQSRDGKTRVLLPGELTPSFLVRAAARLTASQPRPAGGR